MRLTGLTCAADPERWRAAGFAVDDDGTCRIGSVAVRLSGEGRHIRSWSVDGLEGVDNVDGLPVGPRSPAVHRAVHPNGVIEVDHLVVMTPDISRTTDALVATGMEVRRTRDAGDGMQQVFFRLGGPVILEVIGPATARGDGPARFFGLAFTVADLDATAAFLGELLGAVKDAVQPGRQIATLRREAEVGTALAFMSPGTGAIDTFGP